jgi:hypothetical protein
MGSETTDAWENILSALWKTIAGKVNRKAVVGEASAGWGLLTTSD